MLCHSSGIDGENSDYDGMAPEAQLAFFDIGKTGTDALTIPSLYEVVFPAAHDAGAHLHSNSWGSLSQVCDEYCYDIDAYVHDNKV